MTASERRDHSVGALTHLRALDFTGPLGQLCARVMSDMGADVIKVEPPGGDPARRMAPFASGTPHPDGSLVFIDRNRGKRSVVFDIDDPSDQEMLRALASHVDIVVEDHQPGQMAARGLGYEDLKAINPGIVYVSITPFGQTGPKADYKGGELIAQATGGIMYANGDDAQRPAMAPDDLISNIAGLHGAFGALAAIRHRRISNVGQHVDVSRQEVVLYCQGNYIPRYMTSGRIPRREGRQGMMAGINLFQCADGGFVSLAPFQPNHFRRLVNDVMHEPALADPGWSETSFRNDDQNRVMINGFIERFAATQNRDELVALGQSQGVPIVPILTPEEAIALPHNRERGFFRTINQPGVGPILIPGAPVTMGATPWQLDRPAPTIGQHQSEVLTELATPSPARVRRPDPVEATPVPGSLAGLRIADFTRAFAGPIATMFLGFLGAQVIKIESGDLEDNRGGGQATFPELNRAKSSATIDTRTAEGKATAKRLVAESDIVVENFRPDVMDRLGLDYESLRRGRPDLIMISMPGFGKTGGLKDYLAYGQQIIGTTGLLHLWGHPESPLDVRVKYAFPDYVAAISSSLAILAALEYRNETGRGQFIELSQFEALAHLLAVTYADSASNGTLQRSRGNASRTAAPHDVYRCNGEDAWCAIAVDTEDEWRALTVAMGNPPLASDDRFTTRELRNTHKAALDAYINEWTALLSPREVDTALQAVGVSAGALATAKDLYDDPHLRARGMIVDVEHGAQFGKIPHAGPNVHLSGTPSRADLPSPMKGADNDAVFRDILRLTPEEEAALAAAGALR